MDDRRRTITAVALLIGVAVLVVFILGLLLRGESLISPLPEDPAVKIIFISPTIPRVPNIASPSSTLAPTKKVTAATPTKKPVTPTSKTSITPTPSKSTTPSPTIKATSTPTATTTPTP